jgi:hypothetical protein
MTFLTAQSLISGLALFVGRVVTIVKNLLVALLRCDIPTTSEDSFFVDPGFSSYCATAYSQHVFDNPVVLVFVDIMLKHIEKPTTGKKGTSLELQTLQFESGLEGSASSDFPALF